jgi:hypothetical protein
VLENLGSYDEIERGRLPPLQIGDVETGIGIVKGVCVVKLAGENIRVSGPIAEPDTFNALILGKVAQWHTPAKQSQGKRLNDPTKANV